MVTPAAKHRGAGRRPSCRQTRAIIKYMSMDMVRARRFQRAAQVEPRPITPRDVALLEQVHRHRVLNTELLVAIDGGNACNIKERLRRLYDLRLLDRPDAQRYALRHATPRPMVYALGQAGARFLREHGHDINPDLDWSEKNKRAGFSYLTHTLGIASFLVNAELGCRRSAGALRLIGEHELIAAAPEKTRRAREPLRWQASVTDGKGKPATLSVVPDALFALLSSTAPADKNVNVYALEVDNGSIPIRRKGRGHRSIRHKVGVYLAGWEQGRHVAQFGTPAMQVAFVSTTPTRVEHMLDEVLDLTEGRGSRFFLFTDQETLKAADGDPLKAKWINGKGEITALGDD